MITFLVLPGTNIPCKKGSFKKQNNCSYTQIVRQSARTFQRKPQTTRIPLNFTLNAKKMKTLHILIITLALFLPSPELLAQNPKTELKAYIAISDKPDESSSNRKPVREFAIEETAYFAFAVSGMKRNFNNKVDLYASIEVITPEGKTLFAEKKYAPTKKVLPPEQQGLYLSQSFDLTLENTDPLGMYHGKFMLVFNLLYRHKNFLSFSSDRTPRVR